MLVLILLYIQIYALEPGSSRQAKNSRCLHYKQNKCKHVEHFPIFMSVCVRLFVNHLAEKRIKINFFSQPRQIVKYKHM